MKTTGMTQSVCPHCRTLVPAKVVTDNGDVYFQKFCAEHGESKVRVYGTVEDYLKAQRYVKPAWIPKSFGGDKSVSCPDGCGFCERHEQHLCMPIIEITDRCNLTCPVCINESGGKKTVRPDVSLPEFSFMLDAILAAENQVDVLNISGGEPLLHPDLLPLIDEALSRKGIVRVSLSTNGIELLEHPKLLDAIKERDVVVSLQLDGFEDKAYEILRGRPLVEKKRAILAELKDRDITTSLTMTVAEGVNDGEIPSVLAALMGSEHIISLMLQPVAFVGRGKNLMNKIGRLTIPEIVQRLAHSGISPVSKEDFLPLPCSHPLCFSLAFYLVLDDGGIVSVNRLTEAETMLDSISNRVVFGLDAGESEKLKEMIYNLWSGPAGAVPESGRVLKTMKEILRKMAKHTGCSCFDPREAFGLVERQVKSVFVHAFQDADTFDLARTRRCCQAYPQRDGRLLPACAHNVLGGRE